MFGLGNEVFASRLKNIKTTRKTTLPKIAEQLGLQAYVVKSWAAGHGEPDIYYLIRLSKVLNVSVDYLLGISDDIEISHKAVRDDLNSIQG